MGSGLPGQKHIDFIVGGFSAGKSLVPWCRTDVEWRCVPPVIGGNFQSNREAVLPIPDPVRGQGRVGTDLESKMLTHL